MTDLLTHIMLLCAWLAGLLLLFCVLGVIADHVIDGKPWREK